MTKRKLVIDGENWYWYYGISHIPIWRDDVKVAMPDLSELTGMKWHDIEHDQHKENFRVTPGQVTKFIREKILT